MRGGKGKSFIIISRNKKVFDPKIYYEKILNLNLAHYAGETSYYVSALPRFAEKAIARESKRRGAKTILDLCCGSGRLSFFLAEQNFTVTGVDICPEAIKTAKEEAGRRCLNNVNFLVGDVTNLSFKDNIFDVVICPRFSINAVPLYENRLKAVKEMIRVVKPAGNVYIESFNYFYLGQKGKLLIKNILRDLIRAVKWGICFLSAKTYEDLLPGDITYKNNKVKGAPDGYAHLTPYFELYSLAKKVKKMVFKSEILSSYEISGKKDWPIFKFFRYVLWLKLKKKC